MSLSFVSKSIQTGRDDGGFDEAPIEGQANTDSENTRSIQKPLFEQLRDKREQEEADREEMQRSLMRGTLALDEEGAAHLGMIAKQKQEAQQALQREVQSELSAFRAAQVDRFDPQDSNPDSDDEHDATTTHQSEKTQQQPTVKRPAARMLVIKRKKRKEEAANVASKNDPNNAPTRKDPETKPTENTPSVTVKPKASGCLGGLLTGYGSSSDED